MPAPSIPVLDLRDFQPGTAGEAGFVTRLGTALEEFGFFAVARQVDWDAATDQYLRILFQQHGIQVEEDQPLQEMDAIAAAKRGRN